jgi:hypothetical protein
LSSTANSSNRRRAGGISASTSRDLPCTRRRHDDLPRPAPRNGAA